MTIKRISTDSKLSRNLSLRFTGCNSLSQLYSIFSGDFPFPAQVLPCALRERAFDRLRNVNLVRPLLGADGITVQRIDHRIAPLFIFVIAGRQENDHITIDSIALKITFKRCPMNLDVFYRRRL